MGASAPGSGRHPSNGKASIRWIIQFLPSVRNSTNRPCESGSDPERTTFTSRSVQVSTVYDPRSQIVIDPPPYSPQTVPSCSR